MAVIEFFCCNPELAERRPVFGQLEVNRNAGKRPSYVMVKAGCWGEGARQLHRFFSLKDVNIHANAANICMNNVTSYNNYCSNASPGNCVSFNSDGGWLIVNSSILDKTPLALIRGKSRQITICNDILINNNTAGNVILLQTTGKLNDCGHNVVSGTAAPSSSDAWASTDLQGVAESGLGTLSYSSNWTTSPYYGVYTWSGSLTGFTAATQTEVENRFHLRLPRHCDEGEQDGDDGLLVHNNFV